MAVKKIPAFLGINNVKEDAALEIRGDSPGLFVRDAVNINFSDSGRAELAQGMQLQSSKAIRDLWQSPLHKECFAALDGQWVKVNLDTWDTEPLIECGNGPLFHIVLNNLVCMACDNGLFIYDGQTAKRLTIDTPARPQANVKSGYSLDQGDYSFAISWLANGLESALSEIEKVQLLDKSGVQLQLPMCLDSHVTHVRIYMSDPGGSELRQAFELPIDTMSVDIPALPELGRAATFQYLSPMKSGDFLRLWRGRLWVVRSNVLYFSEAMTYHLTDERYNFIQFPQRIRFIEPVDGGIWVGQADHVVFLRGQDMRNMVIEHKASRAPVYASSALLHSDMVKSLSQGGTWCAVWLAENGFVVGTADGQLVELQSESIKGISAQSSQLVGFADRLVAVVN
ncbi:hypothetical protein B9T38_11925 [Acinetobacter sp. ANC 4218]|uniref:hypothetical protein n=1 Tax=Acinetobacter sp. ANC 4218 TaxID=1977880 RepID=UPI000A34161E|nr:hypothetical protein [Acinetobacter sp. ANC 4218]OTG70564.1 hypothetical protein B9T38_11925 [Acinetobacter sp. ANC 4218]